MYLKIEKVSKSKEFTDQNRKELKAWCDFVGGKMYFGDEVLDFKEMKKFCLLTTNA